MMLLKLSARSGQWTNLNNTVNSEIFVRVSFSRNFKIYVKIKSLQRGEITLSTIDICKSHPSHEIFQLQVCLLKIK